MTEADPPTVADVLAAARALRGRVRRTPLMAAHALSAASGAEVLLKLENQQWTGSFKVRGAFNAVAGLSRSALTRGLVAASAGNHGLGVAWAARRFGARATIVVPAGAPLTKRDRIVRLGAELRLVDGDYDEAHTAADALAEHTGATLVHAFSEPAVVAGQGTIGLEIALARPDVRTFLVPVGGGGLVGGVGLVARALLPRARIVGVQSTETAAMHHSLASGALASPAYGPTLCEGLSGDTDERSLALARHVVDEVLLVDEAAVRDAIRYLYVEEGIVAEGSAAVAAAALLARMVDAGGAPVAAVITGGNVDAPRLAEILAAADPVPLHR